MNRPNVVLYVVLVLILTGCGGGGAGGPGGTGGSGGTSYLPFAPTLTAGSTTNVTTNAVTISIMTSNAITQTVLVWAEYGKSIEMTSHTSPVSIVPGGPYQIHLPALDPSSVYYYRFAVQTGSEIAYTSRGTFATLPPFVPEVTVLSATDITTSGARISVAIGQTSTQTVLVWAEYGKVSTALSPTTTSAVPPGRNYVVELSGLDAGYTYYYRFAVRVGNVTGRTSILFFTTLPPVSTLPGVPAIVSISAGNPTTSSFVLAAALGEGQPISSTVWFEYGPSEQFGYATQYRSLYPNGYWSETVRNLQSETKYYFRAVVLNNQYGRRESGTQFLTTLPSAGPSAVPTLGVSTVGAVTQVGATVSVYIGPSSYSTANVWIEYGPTQAFGNTTVSVSVSTGTTATLTIPGLQPGTRYFYHVVVSTPGGTIAGHTYDFTTTPASADNRGTYAVSVSQGQASQMQAYGTTATLASITYFASGEPIGVRRIPVQLTATGAPAGMILHGGMVTAMSGDTIVGLGVIGPVDGKGVINMVAPWFPVENGVLKTVRLTGVPVNPFEGVGGGAPVSYSLSYDQYGEVGDVIGLNSGAVLNREPITGSVAANPNVTLKSFPTLVGFTTGYVGAAGSGYELCTTFWRASDRGGVGMRRLTFEFLLNNVSLGNLELYGPNGKVHAGTIQPVVAGTNRVRATFDMDSLNADTVITADLVRALRLTGSTSTVGVGMASIGIALLPDNTMPVAGNVAGSNLVFTPFTNAVPGPRASDGADVWNGYAVPGVAGIPGYHTVTISN